MHPSKQHASPSIVQGERPHASLRAGAVGVFVSAILVGLGVATGRVAESSVEQEPTVESAHEDTIEVRASNGAGAGDSRAAASNRQVHQAVGVQEPRGANAPQGYAIARGAHSSQLTRQSIEHHSVVRWCSELAQEIVQYRSATAADGTREDVRAIATREAPSIADKQIYADGGQSMAIAALRSFDARPVRAVRTVRMVVTAYSADERSCGTSADGITASGYSVQVNGGCLVAADPKVLPLGSLVSVPGYDGGEVVPVLDTGGAIKGNRLDVLFPTHEAAMRWGRRTLDITIWEYDDGRPNGFKRVRRAPREGA